MNVLSFGSKAIDTRVNHAAHEKLEREVAEFVKNGGEIKQLDCTSKARPLHRVKKQDERREYGIAKYKNDSRVALLRNWVQAKNGRVKRVSELLQMSMSRVSGRINGYTKISCEFFEEMSDAILQIEQEEKRGVM